MSQQLTNGKQQFSDGNGVPLAGGSVAFYQPGTLTPVNTYQDSALTIPNANPLTLDANGMAVIWGADDTQYRQIVQNSAGVTLWDQTVGLTIANAPSESLPAQQFSLAASLLAGALTLTYTPVGPVAFRNTTLTNGSPITFPSPGAPSSITIPNGATLGTTSGVNAMLAVALAYNGGSPVLCVAGASPTLDLSETGLISPTTISAGATSAGIWYSASAVGANSPYRVVGFATVNEVAAGTWATLPAELQGMGGLAFITAMQQAQAPIQAVSASVASNALTVGYAPSGQLSFRNPVLTNGAPVVLPMASGPLTLTVPNGATLGTTNGNQALLALLVAYNAGSPVLCVANIAGGVDLSETNLISPTTISAGATSAATIYSASAVAANSPYRMVGVVTITETTAGTWATAATAVQGVGGMAFAAMQSLGFGQTWQNLSASRVAGTTYYNPSSRPRYVSISNNVPMNGSNAYLTINGIQVSQLGGSASTSNPVYGALSGIVPPQGSYSCNYLSGAWVWAELG